MERKPRTKNGHYFDFIYCGGIFIGGKFKYRNNLQVPLSQPVAKKIKDALEKVICEHFNSLAIQRLCTLVGFQYQIPT